MSGWILAIDFGTTSTAAARSVGHRVEVIQLQSGPRMPSMVFWREGTGATGDHRHAPSHVVDIHARASAG